MVIINGNSSSLNIWCPARGVFCSHNSIVDFNLYLSWGTCTVFCSNYNILS
jgi:hypothetical protein